MKKIEMRNADEAKLLFYKFQNAPFLKGLKVARKENALLFDCAKGTSQLSQVSKAMADYVILEHEEMMLLELIRSTFYFQDSDEQVQILALAKSIIQGEMPDLPGLKHVSPPFHLLYEAFYGFLGTEEYLPYESFIRFRIKPYRECLQQFVEMAIDEYKLEQDYQTFVETLRRLLKKRRPMLDRVKVVYQEEFLLFDENDHPIDELRLRKRLEPIFQTNWGLEAKPSMLLTLIGIAPQKIFLFTDETEIGMIQTIQNVFQERVEVIPQQQSHLHS